VTVPARAPIDPAPLDALADRAVEAGHRGLPPAWWGRTPRALRGTPWRDAAATGPVCVLREDALDHNLTTMIGWCRARGVELAPHGKTHMAPQLAARQLAAGACAITVATVAQAAVYRAFGVTTLVVANQVVDAAGLAWLAGQLDDDPALSVTCWVDSVAGVELMTAALQAGRRPLDVCVEIGVPGGRTGCRSAADADAVARAAADSPRLRLVGVAGYEAARGHDTSAAATEQVRDHLAAMRTAAIRLAPLVESPAVLVSAGGSTYFDAVADVLGDWPGGLAVRTVLRSGCALIHDHGLYAATSPLTRDGAAGLQAALEVRGQVLSRPEPGLALVGVGRRDVSFDQGLPVALDLPNSTVTALNDQHAYLSLGPGADPAVGDWLRFGVSHPCTTFDKWRLIPLLDRDDRVVDLIRTFF
jgi:D-serine deaminase-like pyridoxal phosphate-dependent protein